MAFGRKSNSGLDLSGVGKRSRKVSGGNVGGGSGFGLRPRSSVPRSPIGTNLTSSDTYKGAMRSARRERRLPARTVAAIVAVVAFILALAFLVGFLVYQQTVRDAVKPGLDKESLESALVEPQPDSAFWTLLASTDASSAEEGRGSLVNTALMYVNPDNKSLSLLWIPADTRIYIDGYGYRRLAAAYEMGHEAGLCSAVAKLSGVDLGHYMEVNQAGVTRLGELLGVDLAAQGDATARVTAVAKKVFGSSSEQLVTRAEHMSSCIASDMDESDAAQELSVLQGMDTDSEIYSENMPCSAEDVDGQRYSIVDTNAWATMVARVTNGMTPVATQSELGSYEQVRSNNEVEIWNGVGVSGVAKDCADELVKHGWTIQSTGNAAQFVYEETLVVYKDNADETAASLIVSDLGQGRVVRSAFRYNFKGDVLVVVGKDYQPH